MVAVVVPAVLITSGPPQAKPQVYSAQQVLRVFKAKGIALKRAPDDEPNTGRVTFDGLGNAQLSIGVLAPTKTSTTFLWATSCSGTTFPAVLSHGNLEVAWCRASRADVRRIDAALGQLQYSPTDALRPPPPTFVLHLGTSRTIDAATTPAGAAVDCVNGAATASQPVLPRMRASRIEVAAPSDAAGAPTNYATLAWQPSPDSRFRFSCQ